MVAEGKRTREFNGEIYILETGLVADAPEGVGPGDAFVGFTFAPFSRSTDRLARRAASGRNAVAETQEAPQRCRAGSPDVGHLIPVVHAQIIERGDRSDAGIADENVEAAYGQAASSFGLPGI